jgi:hypothetical protein
LDLSTLDRVNGTGERFNKDGVMERIDFDL